MAKYNILVVPSDNMGGVGFYRSTQPHIQLEKQFPEEFSVTIDMQPNWRDLHSFDKYDLIHIHKALFRDMQGFYLAMEYFKLQGIVTVMDIDDHWQLSPHHPQYQSNRIYDHSKVIMQNIRLFDYVTTTTPIFAERIAKINKNVKIFPNAIDPTDERFKVNKPKSDFIRVGLIMGSSHEYDMMLLKDVASKIGDSLDKVQFVLCGFDLRGTIKIINKETGEVNERPITPKESVWYRYEKMLTNDYKIVSKDYKEFLELFLNNVQYPGVEKEHYKRCWTKDMDHYYEHYSEVDILLAPLEVNEFNLVKSPLKVAECAFSHTAIIASEVGPYTLDLHSAIKFGGEIDPNGNALLVNPSKNHKDWAKYVKKLVENPDLLKQLQDNLYESVHEKYDLRNVTKDRAKFYAEIINNKKNEKAQ